MKNEIIGIVMLIIAFGLGYAFGVRRSDWQLREATKRIDHALQLIKNKNG